VLGGVRPSATRRSWWLREALAAEPADLAGAAPPLVGSPTADVVIVGGGYTGLWTAWRLVGARIVREAIVRTESAEERGVRPGPVIRQLSRPPRRLGYHLGPE